MLHAQPLPGIRRCSDKGGDWDTFGSPRYLQRVWGTAARKAEQWVYHSSIFQVCPSTVHPVQRAAVQPRILIPNLRPPSLVP